MVKANAYGLGVDGVVARLEQENPRGYGVATTAEGLQLRALGIRRPIVVFAPPPAADVEPALAGGLTLCVSSVEMLEGVVRGARLSGIEAEVQLEIDTGMGRAGALWRDVVSDPAPFLRGLDRARGAGVRWTGCFTHFHSADEPGSPGVDQQAARFRQALQVLDAPAAGPGFQVHCANSAAALRGLPGWGDPVRPGIHLYGGSVGEGVPEPEPVVHLRARIVHVRAADPGETAGYGSTYVAGRPEVWATAALGYGDGLPRALGNRGHALLRGHPVPIVGRVSMDMTVLDVTECPGGAVTTGEVATFLGEDGNGAVTVDSVADLAGTISYEILTGLAGELRLPRVWRTEGEEGR